jgi:hypothetical protein
MRAAIVLRSSNSSPVGGPYFDPRHGTIVNHVNIGAPRGFGPNQINSGHEIELRHIYSRGGTALRLESDDARGRFGAEVRDLVASDIVGERCNRAVAFAPHAQVNQNIAVTGVRALSCYQGVIESADEGLPRDRRGSFVASTIDDVDVIAGDGAQLPSDDGGWTTGPSSQAFAHDAKATWNVQYGAHSCTGPFTRRSSRIMTAWGFERPRCGPTEY